MTSGHILTMFSTDVQKIQEVKIFIQFYLNLRLLLDKIISFHGFYLVHEKDLFSTAIKTDQSYLHNVNIFEKPACYSCYSKFT